MDRTSTWLVLIVAAALVAGVGAFVIASPSQASRIPSSELGFGTLDRSWFDERLAATAAVADRADARAAARRRAETVSRRWLTALPGARLEPASIVRGIAVAPDSAESRRRIAVLRRWSDSIPAGRWRIVVGTATAPVGSGDAWTVAAAVHVRLASAATRTRIVRVPVVLHVAEPVRESAPWRVLDVRVDAPARGLRAYTDPVVVRSGATDVVAPSVARDDAVTIAATFAGAIDEARDRIPLLARRSTTTVWLYDGPARLRAVADSDVPLRDGAHPIARVLVRGDVFVDRRAWRAASAATRTAALRHAALHVAWGDAADVLAPVVREGVAAAFAATPGEDLLDEVADMRSPSLADLLVADADGSLTSESQRRLSHVAGAWLLDEGGADALGELVRQREAGIDADHAIRRSLHATPAGVEGRVRAWAAAGGRAPRELVADDGGDADTEEIAAAPETESTDGDGMLVADDTTEETT